MVLSPAITWPTLTSHYAGSIWPPLASLARSYYAQQGRLLPAVNYLALPPTAAAEPFIGNLAASELIRAVLPAVGPTEETYPQYVQRGTPETQSLLTVLTAVLNKRGISLADFKQALTTEQASYYLLALLGPEFWTPVTAAWQQQVQRQLDEAGRWQSVLDAYAASQATLVALHDRLVVIYPTASIESLSTLPINELARDIWSPTPAVNFELAAQIIGGLQWVAQGLIAQNYPESELLARFLEALPADIAPIAQIVVSSAEGQSALTTVAELVTADIGALTNRLLAIPANSPVVYALAGWFQTVLRQFIVAQTPDAPASQTDSVVVQGRLLGTGENPLPNFNLRLTQILTSREGVERSLGSLRTGIDGRFALEAIPDRYLNDNDEVVEASTHIRAAVYYPSQDTTGEPVLILELSTEETEVVYQTDLSLTIPAPASRTLTSISLPDTLRQLLSDNNVATLADVRAADNFPAVIADLLPEDTEAIQAAKRLNGLAQFEVVGQGDAAFHERVIDLGYYSLAQLLTATQAEFVSHLLGDTEPDALQARAMLVEQVAGDTSIDALRTQGIVFYQQASAVQSLSQTLGLLTTGAQASGTVQVVDRTIPIKLPGFPGGTPIFLPAPTPHYNPAPAGAPLSYDSSQQCDCPACRSAVSPTAYLAALLKYGTDNLRNGGATPAVSALNLQELFYQPFTELRVSCQTAQDAVCQYRLSIEVIQAHYRAHSLAPLTMAEARPYVEAMLDALLQALGTSLDELRIATTPALSDELATRLALPAAVVTDLRDRFSASQLVDTRPLSEVEADMEHCFGLMSTARDPLTTGLLLSSNTGAVQLVHWSFDGVEWGVNTGTTGQLYLEVVANSALQTQVTVYKGTSPLDCNEDNVVARGNFSAQGNANLAAVLYPQHDSGLRGSVVIKALTSAADVTFTLSVIPTVTAGQQQALQASWLSQDTAAMGLLRAKNNATWNGRKFLIDPDLLGPDDFRPIRRQTDLDNVAYMLWRRRYDFLQTDLPAQLLSSAVPSSTNLGALLDALSQRTLTYTKLDTTQASFSVWPTSLLTGTAELTQLHANLVSQSTSSAATGLGMSTEAVQRLYELWQQSLGSTPITDSELQEALDIVRQSAKKALEIIWQQEEESPALNGPVVLSLDFFQPALHEPQAGTWQQLRPAEFGLVASALPRLDPDEVTPLDLPDDGYFGKWAATTWGARQAELLQKRQAIVASGLGAATAQARADAMLAYAYRPDLATPTTGLPGTAPYGTLELNWAAYQNTADLRHTDAEQYFSAVLALRPTEAERLVALRSLVTTAATDNLWQEMAALLALAWKRAVAYRQAYVAEGTAISRFSWLAEETVQYSSQPTLDYFIGTRKHRLVKWRADATIRTQWAAALNLAAQRPLIDPDQLVPGDFRHAGERSRNLPVAANPANVPYLNPAYNLYQRRAAQVKGWEDLMDLGLTAATPLSDQWDLVTFFLKTTQDELTTLYSQQQANVDVSAALRRLTLTPAGLELIYTQLDTPATTNRLDELRQLLVQVLRTRTYANWAREEIELSLIPCPLYFREPQLEAESLAITPWRSSATERRQWQRALSARFDQTASLATAREQTVRNAEDQYLYLLRDELIGNPLLVAPSSFESKQDWLNSQYLLDFKTACCQHTTRVAQAIEVLQKLFMNVRGGLASNGLSLSNTDTTFEADWQWLSSYERWLSLMFLYLYPQNVLLPALKPGQTSQFRQTVSTIRQAAGLTPADARGYMDDYQAYLNDLNTLIIATATETSLDAISTDGFTASGDRQPVSVQVALAASRTAYATVFNLTGTPTANAYVWMRLPGEALVERIVGSTTYQPVSGQRYVYVFALLREEQKNALDTIAVYLAFQRLNLTTLQWDEDYTRLSLSDTTTLDISSVQVVHNSDESLAPVVLGLRNRRVPLYTEAPFSQAAYKDPNTGVTDSGEALELHRVIPGASNTDFFFAALDVQGTGIGLEQTRTFLLSSSVTLLASIQTTQSVVRVIAAIDASLNSFKFSLKNYGSKPRYFFSHTFEKQDALKVVYDNSYYSPVPWFLGYQLPRNSNPHTSLFSSGQIPSYFEPIINNLKLLYTSSDPTVPVEDRATGIVIGGISQTISLPNATLIPAGARVDVVQGGALSSGSGYSLEQFYLSIYYNENTNISGTATPDTVRTSGIKLYFGGNFFQGGSSPYDGPSMVSPLMPFNYTGPAVRSSYDSTSGATATPVANVTEHSSARYANSRNGTLTIGLASYKLHLILTDLPPLFSALTPGDLNNRHTALKALTYLNSINQGFVGTLISEAYYALPMLLAQELTRSRNYELALHYYRLVYDYTRKPNNTLGLSADPRLVYPGLYNATATATYDTALAWLENPNNPYTLAALRPDSHLHYVVMSVARCLLAYADAEFTADTTESVSRARTLYELAARLLKQDITQYAVPDCASLLDPLDDLFPATWLAEWQALKSVLAKVNQRNVLEQILHQAAVDGVTGRGLGWLFAQPAIGNGSKTWSEVFNQAWVLVNGQLATLYKGYLTLTLADPQSQLYMQDSAGTIPLVSTPRPYVPFLGTNFCVPTNPVPYALALQAELNLFKIRSCRNIAGVQRELDAYAAATDNTTGLPTLSSTGQLALSARLVVPATPFRYSYIIERARQIVALAQQTEASLLSALEKRDAEAYNQLKARQDIAISQATVQLQTLRVTEAEDGVDLAGLQLDRSEIMEAQYDQWLSDGLNGYEQDMLDAIQIAGAAKAIAAAVTSTNVFSFLSSFGGSAVAAAANAAAAIADTVAQISQAKATYKRREDEWNFQKNLAAQDIRINQQQIKIANDQVKVVGQEKRISQLQFDHATAVLNFLTTKFTNAELYDWMSGILQSAYSYFLQQATATARLAEQQLAFERQQVPAGIIQADYYSDPTDDVSAVTGLTSGSTSNSTDRRGLTGSVRLLQDLTRLDEYAFETTKRKLQLTKTISLAQSFPTEFVRFRDTGVLPFACQPEWFDQDFPGHYLRVLRRVRTSVIALVPTVESIKARLTTAGTSHVTVDGTPFQTLTLPRAQENVALTSPSNATGLFELDQQSSELLLPFEGMGVDVPWVFSMQPASNANLDYSTIADVLITLDYTALDSADYARQVVKQLGTERQQQVVLSMRNRFADQWYDLHHADELTLAQQYVSTLTLTADDLPRNLRGMRVSQVSLFVDAPLDDDLTATGAFADRSHLELGLTRGTRGLGGVAFTNQYGLISTRTGTGTGPLYTGNAATLVPLIGTTPAGDWTLTIGPGRLRDRLAAGLVTDIYLILEVEGDAPAYVL